MGLPMKLSFQDVDYYLFARVSTTTFVCLLPLVGSLAGASNSCLSLRLALFLER